MNYRQTMSSQYDCGCNPSPCSTPKCGRMPERPMPRAACERKAARPACDCQPACGCSKKMDAYPVAMAYVPWQYYHDTFDLQHALMMGTIFPELCQPFCGRGPRC